MIGFIRGKLVVKAPPHLTVDVGGVGYDIEAPMSTFYTLPALGSEVRLLTHLVVREDAHILYGFGTQEERALFRNLLKVSQIGPKIALAILSGTSVEGFTSLVKLQDAAALTKIPGVGRKTAERVLMEMKDRLDKLEEAAQGMTVSGAVPMTPNEHRRRGMDRAGGAGIQARRSHRHAQAACRPGRHHRRPDPPRIAGHGAPAVNTANEKSGERIVTATGSSEEEAVDRAIRPKRLADYVGQEQVKAQLEIFVKAAVKRGEALDHALIFGPPGLGKTTLANILAGELGVNLRQTSGPVLERPGDLAALLTNLQPRDVLFIDEIHRLSAVVEEVLYPAMEDYQLDIMIGEGPAARSIKLALQPFTLIGATTRAGLLTSPLRDRFGIVQRLEFYTTAELEKIVTRSSGILGVPIDADGANRIAQRSRGTPRIANRLLRRVRDYAEVKGSGRIDEVTARAALDLLEVDPQGFDALDRKLLGTIIEKFDGGPVGIESLAAAIGEERGTLEDVIEPFLIQQGFPDAHRTRSHGHAGRVPAFRTQGARARLWQFAAVRALSSLHD